MRNLPGCALALAVVVPLLAAQGAAADDVLRCDENLIRVGMIAPQVVAKCGEPKAKESEDIPVRVRRANGTMNTVGVTRVERWTYDRGYGKFPAVLTFEQGKLKNIELLTDR